MPKDSKKCTLTKLAAIIGVAPSTVSRVLNKKHFNIPVTEETARRIREEAVKQGYCPNINAKRLLQNKAFVIGLEVPAWNLGEHAFSDFTMIETMKGIEDVVAGSEYKLMLLFKNKSYMETRENLSLLRENAIDGLLVWGGSYLDSYAEELCKFPIVFVNTLPKLPRKVEFVGSANFQASFELTSCAIAQGCRKFIYFNGPDSNSISVARREGFLKALEAGKRAGAACLRQVAGDFRADSARVQMESMLSKDGVFFDCVVCANDNMALGVMDAARSRGLSIPEAFKLAGGDGVNPNSERFGLTTFKCDFAETGRLATKKLLSLIDGASEAKPSATELACELLRRTSL